MKTPKLKCNKVVTYVKKVGGKFSRTGLRIRKVSPELLLGAGIVVGVAAIVAGCMASRHLDAVLDEANEKLDDIQEVATINSDVDEKDIRRDSLHVYLDTAKKLAVLYAPTAGLAVASGLLILTSHGILKQRYLSTAAAYKALDEAFKDYKKRVRDVLGEDPEKFLASGQKAETDICVVDEDGNTRTIPGDTGVTQDDIKKSPYEFDFNKHTAPLVWDNNPIYNDARLQATQRYFNDILMTRGHVFLNEVLDELGLERTPAGQVCGWMKGCGDDYVDFGYVDTFIHDCESMGERCVKNIHLNFNCDGSIWDMI